MSIYVTPAVLCGHMYYAYLAIYTQDSLHDKVDILVVLEGLEQANDIGVV
jgi:hypothetical protein